MTKRQLDRTLAALRVLRRSLLARLGRRSRVLRAARRAPPDDVQ